MASRQFGRAFLSLEKYVDDQEVRPTVRRLTTLATESIEASLDTSENHGLVELERLLFDLGPLLSYLPDSDQAVERIHNEAQAIIRRLLGSSYPMSPATHRAVEEIALRDAPNLKALLRSEAVPANTVSVTVDPVSGNCGQLMQATDLRTHIVQSLPPWLAVTDGTASATLRLEAVGCATESVTSDPRPVSSTYIASYQQTVNPIYVQLQEELRQAQVQLVEARRRAEAPFASVYAGVAVGLASGRVYDLSARLRATQPFTSQPVTLSYQAEEFTVTRELQISGNLRVTDAVTSWSDGTYIAHSSADSANGFRNVLPRDTRGLRNREPRLADDSSLIQSALAGLQEEISAGVKALGNEVFVPLLS